jgi:hypothetical protein
MWFLYKSVASCAYGIVHFSKVDLMLCTMDIDRLHTYVEVTTYNLPALDGVTRCWPVYMDSAPI